MRDSSFSVSRSAVSPEDSHSESYYYDYEKDQHTHSESVSSTVASVPYCSTSRSWSLVHHHPHGDVAHVHKDYYFDYEWEEYDDATLGD